VALHRRQAWLEQKQQQEQRGKGRGGKGGGRPAAAADPLDMCLDVLEGRTAPKRTPKAAKDEEAVVGKALEELKVMVVGGVKAVRDPVLATLAPRCPHHQQKGRLLRVKKAGRNKGRRFYVCSFPRGWVVLGLT
jgi:hypothetical protein